MTSGHSDLGADLLALADTVLTRLDPILRRVAETQQERDQQGCSWCPVCALAALVRGERHDLVELVASEGAVVIALLRQLLADHTGSGHSSPGHSSPDHTSPDHTSPDRTSADHTDAGSTTPGPSPTEDGADPVPTEQADLSNVSLDTNDAGNRRAAFVPITVRVKDSRAGTHRSPETGEFEGDR